VRIWDVDPALLCRAHLLGEHRELHGLWNILTLGKTGYRNHPETRRWEGRLSALHLRHEALVAEMYRRGYRHESPLDPALASGSAVQELYVDSPKDQRRILREKPCACFTDTTPMRLTIVILAALGMLSMLSGCARPLPPSDHSPGYYDVIIRNGTVYDGSGGPGRAADVGIAGDRIAAVGDLSNARGGVEVDAAGLAVAPGFINVLSWATTSLIHDGRAQSDVRQGVTMVVFGEGSSPGPLNAGMKAALLARQDDIRYDIEWTTLGEYLEYLEGRGVSPNVASFVGATTVRIHELGYADRAPTPAELDRMRTLVGQAMEEGALGLGSSLIYAPAFYAATDELIALAGEAGRHGGIYISHIRSEGNALLGAVDELITIAREAGVPAEIYHLKAAGEENWAKIDTVIARIEAARAEGLRITADMYTYTAGATGLDAAMPPWVQEGGFDEWRMRLQDPAIRARVLDEMRTPTAEWESLYLLAGSPERVILVDFRQDSLRHLTGQSLAEVARMRGTSPEETAMDLVVQDESRVGTVYFLMSEENVRKQIRLPWMSFGSDAAALAPEGVFLRSNPHPRAYGNFARLLGRYVREEQLIPLEEAVRRLTALPAENFGLRDRGALQAGFLADVVVFDPATITDHATFEDPHRYATGVHHVWVNGVGVLRDGEHTGALPGRVVRGPGWRGWHDSHAIPASARRDTMALRRALEESVRAFPGEMAIALIDLATGARVGIGDQVVMHAASTMKVPVLLELYRQVAQGRLTLEDPVRIRATFTSMADGSPYTLDEESDSETALYRLIGRDLPRGELARRMVVRSSNLATNLLIEEIGPDAIARTLSALDADGLTVLRGVEDIPAHERGMNNTTTAAALAQVFAALARCEAGDVPAALRPMRPADCALVTETLAAHEFVGRIPAGIPGGVRVANKTGWITAVDHDAAIVYPPGRDPYVLVALTRGIEDRVASAAAIRNVSAVAWRELAPAPPWGANGRAPTGPAALAALHARHRVDGLDRRTFTHRQYWSIVTPIVESAPGLRLEEIGRSVQGRSLNAIHYGSGPTRVLLWSQMHGDESTATMALADIFAFLAAQPDHALARRLAANLTVVAVPMLNPDGADRFERRNALGIDINRDARALATPEGRALKSIRDRIDAHFGFNLHDQNVRLRVGDTHEQAAIALLAPPWGESRDDDDVRERAARVAGVLRLAVDSLVEGRIARYDDAFNPRAFGDLMQQWGTSTVLVESGGWHDDPEKQHLRLANFVGVLAALDAIASGAYRDVSPGWYRSLPFNGPAAVDLLLSGGHVVLPGAGRGRGVPEPFRADVAVQYADPSRWIGPGIADLGDLREVVARRSLEIDGLFLHVERDGAGPLGPVRRAVVRSGPEPGSAAIWVIDDGGPVRAAGPDPASRGPGRGGP
jgi:N-acyl-D-amino-acid deacylase